MKSKILDISFKPEKEKIFFGYFGHYIRIDNISHEIAKKLKEAAKIPAVWLVKSMGIL